MDSQFFDSVADFPEIDPMTGQPKYQQPAYGQSSGAQGTFGFGASSQDSFGFGSFGLGGMNNQSVGSTAPLFGAQNPVSSSANSYFQPQNFGSSSTFTQSTQPTYTTGSQSLFGQSAGNDFGLGSMSGFGSFVDPVQEENQRLKNEISELIRQRETFEKELESQRSLMAELRRRTEEESAQLKAHMEQQQAEVGERQRKINEAKTLLEQEYNNVLKARQQFEQEKSAYQESAAAELENMRQQKLQLEQQQQKVMQTWDMLEKQRGETSEIYEQARQQMEQALKLRESAQQQIEQAASMQDELQKQKTEAEQEIAAKRDQDAKQELEHRRQIAQARAYLERQRLEAIQEKENLAKERSEFEQEKQRVMQQVSKYREESQLFREKLQQLEASANKAAEQTTAVETAAKQTVVETAAENEDRIDIAAAAETLFKGAASIAAIDVVKDLFGEISDDEPVAAPAVPAETVEPVAEIETAAEAEPAEETTEITSEPEEAAEEASDEQAAETEEVCEVEEAAVETEPAEAETAAELQAVIDLLLEAEPQQDTAAAEENKGSFAAQWGKVAEHIQEAAEEPAPSTDEPEGFDCDEARSELSFGKAAAASVGGKIAEGELLSQRVAAELEAVLALLIDDETEQPAEENDTAADENKAKKADLRAEMEAVLALLLEGEDTAEQVSEAAEAAEETAPVGAFAAQWDKVACHLTEKEEAPAPSTERAKSFDYDEAVASLAFAAAAAPKAAESFEIAPVESDEEPFISGFGNLNLGEDEEPEFDFAFDGDEQQTEEPTAPDDETEPTEVSEEATAEESSASPAAEMLLAASAAAVGAVAAAAAASAEKTEESAELFDEALGFDFDAAADGLATALLTDDSRVFNANNLTEGGEAKLKFNGYTSLYYLDAEKYSYPVFRDVTADVKSGSVTGILSSEPFCAWALLRAAVSPQETESGSVTLNGRPIEKDKVLYIGSDELVNSKQTAAAWLSSVLGSRFKVNPLLHDLDMLSVKRSRLCDLDHAGRIFLLLAAASVGEHDVIILNDPEFNINTDNAATARKVFAKLTAAGKTVLLATASQLLMQTVCSDIMVLHYGRLLYQDSFKGFVDMFNRDLLRVMDADSALTAILASDGRFEVKNEDGVLLVRRAKGQAANVKSAIDAALAAGADNVQLRSCDKSFRTACKEVFSV